MSFTELKTVEEPIIDWARELGWDYVTQEDLIRNEDEPFDLATLKDAIIKLNPEVIRDADDADKVVNQLRLLANNIYGNREFFKWIKGEHSIVLRAGEKAQTIKLIENDPDKILTDNVFVVTNQFKFSGHKNVRFDVVLMINGLPIVLIEAKAPATKFVDYHDAIKQIRRYNEEAPQFCKYIALNCATDGINFRYGGTITEKFFTWKGGEFKDPLENSVKALFRKEFLISFINNYIVFEKEREQVRKKIAMYQQVYAADKIVERVLEGKTKKGLIWHTQGSGKSLTMLFAAWQLKKASELNNPTILLMVDRINLQKQLLGSFKNVDLPYTAKAESTKQLVNKLKKGSREVIITTIQKFQEMEQVLSPRENIIIFIDEAHRTQYGKLAMKMRRAFPNAFIFGFTGTPIDKGIIGKSTFRAFCPSEELYLHKYGIKQSVEDGATVKLLHMKRMPKHWVNKKELDKEFLETTKDLSEDDQNTVLKKNAKLGNIVKSAKRVNEIAKDIAEHYIKHIEPNGFKAQLVAYDREACALYKEALDKYLPPEYSTVIYTAGQNDVPLLKKHHMDSDKQSHIARTIFQKLGENPRILIVTDMLLTGFDAPIEQVMYLDKPMRDHGLLQAIARTNRPYPGKEAGIIVDYIGIFRALIKALNFKDSDIEGVAYDFDILRQEFTRTMEVLLKLFENVPRHGERDTVVEILEVLRNQDNYKEFKTNFSKLKRIYATIAPDPYLFRYDNDYTFLIGCNEIYNKDLNRDKPDLSSYDEKTKALIQKHVIVNKIDKDFPVFKINKQYLEEIYKQNYTQKRKISELRSSLSYHIKMRLGTNPIYESLSQRLEKIIKIRDEARRERELEALVKEIVQIEEEAKKLGLTKEEHAILNTVKKYVTEKNETTIPFIKEITQQIKDLRFPGWQKKRQTINQVEETIFDQCFNKYSKKIGNRDTSKMTEEILQLIKRYHTQ